MTGLPGDEDSELLSTSGSSSPLALPPPSRPRRRGGRGGVAAPPVRVALQDCKYPLLRRVADAMGWRAVEQEGDGDYFDVFWTDNSVSLERVVRLRPTQLINHLPGMLALCRKRRMADHLGAMQRSAPDAFGFFPTTFNLPGDEAALVADAAARGRRQAYIIKPDAGFQVISDERLRMDGVVRACSQHWLVWSIPRNQFN
jgi:hypothetical protein